MLSCPSRLATTPPAALVPGYPAMSADGLHDGEQGASEAFTVRRRYWAVFCCALITRVLHSRDPHMWYLGSR